MKKVRTLWAITLAATCLIAPTSTAGEGRNPTPITRTRATEVQAVAHGGYFAWVKDQGKRGWQLYLRHPNDKVVHVNRRGTNGGLGSLTDTHLMFREYTRKRSTIRLMNLKTGRIVNAPAAVNARGTHEFFPVMSDDWLVFGRFDPRPYKVEVVAYNRDTGRRRVLYRSPYPTDLPYVQPGQVTDRFSVMVLWERGERAKLLVHDLRDRSVDVLFGPGRTDLWAPSIRSDGAVYSIATGARCGSRARMIRYSRQRDGYYDYQPRVLTWLGAGYDSWNSQTYLDAEGDLNVLYQRSKCGARRISDIWSFNDMLQLTVTKEGLGSGTVSSTPEGIDCGDVCSAMMPGGGWVTLTATADPLAEFEGWTGPCVSYVPPDEECLLKLDGATEVTATFEPGI